MATVDIEIASRRYSVACREGEQDRIQSVAGIVDRKAREVGQALGSLSEARQLLFASLLLADELKERAAGGSPSSSLEPADDPLIASALERLAERVELLAEKLENQA